MLSLVKSLLKAVPDTKVGVARSTGILTQLLDGGEELGGVLYNTCVKLIQHIMSRQPCAAIAGASPSNRDRQSKEVSSFGKLHPRACVTRRGPLK